MVDPSAPENYSAWFKGGMTAQKLQSKLSQYQESVPDTINHRADSVSASSQRKLIGTLKEVENGDATPGTIACVNQMIDYRAAMNVLADKMRVDVEKRHQLSACEPINGWDYLHWHETRSKLVPIQRVYSQIIHDWGSFARPGRAGCPASRFGPPYDKPCDYLACYFVEIGFDEQQVKDELEVLAARSARGMLGLFGVAAIWQRVVRGAKGVYSSSLRKLGVPKK